MRHALCGILLGALIPTALIAKAGDEMVELPSGRSVTFQDVIWGEPGPAGLTVRFRFLDPELRKVLEDLTFVETEPDMLFLCETYALPRISSTGPQPNQVVISIADRPVPFGEADPEASQIFEAYRPEGATCIWEGF